MYLIFLASAYNLFTRTKETERECERERQRETERQRERERERERERGGGALLNILPKYLQTRSAIGFLFGSVL